MEITIQAKGCTLTAKIEGQKVTFYEGASYVAAYDRATLLSRPAGKGLCLDMNEPAWNVSAGEMDRLRAFLRLS